jgi:tight adherence protein B
MDLRMILVFVFAALAVGAIVYVFVVPSGNRAEKRQKAIEGTRTVTRAQGNAVRDAQLRRSQIADSLKEIEKRDVNSRNPPLRVRLERAGLDWEPRKYYVLSAICALLLGAAAFLWTGMWLIAFFAMFTGALGLPRWILKHLIKRRQKRFLKEFPNSLDIIVRGVKSGLPLGDCIRIVASESQEPVRREFRAIMETQAVGMALDEAIDRLYERVGVPEANFFAIVIAIQSKAGGNLSEALGNLARVLRERAKMKGKIQAMSMEAKASGGIIGALPIFVGLMVYLMSPDYLRPLWETNTGLIMLGVAAFWMGCGIMTMRQMINFDF